jgi:hypothetical protein
VFRVLVGGLKSISRRGFKVSARGVMLTKVISKLTKAK